MTDLAVIIPCYNEALSITDTLTRLKPAIVKHMVHWILVYGFMTTIQQIILLRKQ